jgi:hypothetical protein
MAEVIFTHGNVRAAALPANQMSYDTEQFYNAGVSAAAARGFHSLLPRCRRVSDPRLLALTLRDLRRLARIASVGCRGLQGRLYGRLAVCRTRPSRCSDRLLAGLAVGAKSSTSAHRCHARSGSDLDAALIRGAETARSRPPGLQFDDRLASPQAGSRRLLLSGARGILQSRRRSSHRLLRRRSARVRFTEIDIFGVYVARCR